MPILEGQGCHVESVGVCLKPNCAFASPVRTVQKHDASARSKPTKSEPPRMGPGHLFCTKLPRLQRWKADVENHQCRPILLV